MSKKTIRILLLAAVACATVAPVLAGCGSSNTEAATKPTPKDKRATTAMPTAGKTAPAKF